MGAVGRRIGERIGVGVAITDVVANGPHHIVDVLKVGQRRRGLAIAIEKPGLHGGWTICGFDVLPVALRSTKIPFGAEVSCLLAPPLTLLRPGREGQVRKLGEVDRIAPPGADEGIEIAEPGCAREHEGGRRDRTDNDIAHRRSHHQLFQ